ncbi:hypothetical protein KY311_04500, partial [Candidatus Woesearchaeota archaeon]|nr:hypothetical protein [Candidatus Woesearchaeota archaeon]
MLQINNQGLTLHTRYAYPAFASLEKYKLDLPFLEQNTRQVFDLKTLLGYFHRQCPYLLLYVRAPFEEQAVRNYWIGSGKKSHSFVKFRDWLLDDILLNDFTKSRSIKCDINELNRCNVIPAQVIEVDEEPVVEYYVYRYDGEKLELVKEQSRLKLLFKDEI